MTDTELIERIAGGRTDLVFDLLARPNRDELLRQGPVSPLSWFVYYGDATALRAVLSAGGTWDGIDLDTELRHASFFGHWKVVDLLMMHGADVSKSEPETGETALHSALSKAGRPYYLNVVRILVENGADVNARTVPGQPTGAFMRDARTRGETPLHRAAAFADAETVSYLLAKGADKSARDAAGDSPLSWASWHLRTGDILYLLQFDEHHVSHQTRLAITSDHGAGWGNAMERNIVGEFLPESIETHGK